MREMAACPVQQQVEEETPGEARRTEVLDLALQQTLLLVGASDGSVRAWRARAVEAPAAVSPAWRRPTTPTRTSMRSSTSDALTAAARSSTACRRACSASPSPRRTMARPVSSLSGHGPSRDSSLRPAAKTGFLRIWDVESGAELQKIRFGLKVKKSGKAKRVSAGAG